MTQSAYVRITGILFGLIAAVHALRVVRHWSVMIGSHSIQLRWSLVAAVVTGYLALVSLKLARRPQ